MNLIEDDEILYRSFPDPDSRNSQQPPITHYKVENGVLSVLRTAFNDRRKTPSVDRGNLIKSIHDIRFSQNDAVIQISAKDVRGINGISGPSDENRTHDAVFDPTPERPAHTLITTTPPFPSDQMSKSEEKKWKQFQESLALAASKYGLINE